MDATVETIPTSTREDYKSRPGALIWFFRKSRDRWKSKYQDLKATVKGDTNRIADLTKSREQWRKKAEQAREQRIALEAEIAGLRAQVAAAEKKNGTGRWPAEAQPG
jgi:septal ring factor EnvC (AmiA/AmiB activator)